MAVVLPFSRWWIKRTGGAPSIRTTVHQRNLAKHEAPIKNVFGGRGGNGDKVSIPIITDFLFSGGCNLSFVCFKTRRNAEAHSRGFSFRFNYILKASEGS